MLSFLLEDVIILMLSFFTERNVIIFLVHECYHFGSLWVLSFFSAQDVISLYFYMLSFLLPQMLSFFMGKCLPLLLEDVIILMLSFFTERNVIIFLVHGCYHFGSLWVLTFFSAQDAFCISRCYHFCYHFPPF